MEYLRTIVAPIRTRLGLAPDDLFPLPDLDRVGPARALVPKEQIREGATIVMLAGVAWAVTGDFRTWLSALALIFGVWDLAYYAWLRVLLGWPTSVFDWDILFLLPVPWAAPVLAPLISASSLAWGGVVALLNPPARVSKIAWLLLVGAGVVMTATFAWDWRYWLAGGMPRGFPWAVFGAAELMGVVGYLLTRKPDPSASNFAL